MEPWYKKAQSAGGEEDADGKRKGVSDDEQKKA